MKTPTQSDTDKLDARDTVILDSFARYAEPNPKTGRMTIKWKQAFEANPEWERTAGAQTTKGMQALYNRASALLRQQGLINKPNGNGNGNGNGSPVKHRRKRKPQIQAQTPGHPLAPQLPAAPNPALDAMLATARSGMIHHAILTTLHDVTRTMFETTLNIQATLVALNQQVIASGVPHGPH